MPAAFHRASSALVRAGFVAARDEGCGLGLDRLERRRDVRVPLIPAGSAFGPISTKSLYMTGRAIRHGRRRRTFSSCARVHEDDVGVAAPAGVERLPGALAMTTRTSMPVLALNRGRMWLNRPES
jgi:hypothetical protein